MSIFFFFFFLGEGPIRKINELKNRKSQKTSPHVLPTFSFSTFSPVKKILLCGQPVAGHLPSSSTISSNSSDQKHLFFPGSQMKEKMKLIVVNLSLLFLSLHLSSLFHFAIAKGGLISSNFSGLERKSS